jgi:hypothetical protein
MLHNRQRYPLPEATPRVGEISEPGLQRKLEILRDKSGLTAFEQEFTAKLRGGHQPNAGEIAVFRHIWRRHCRSVAKINWEADAS